jgi:hypothetical protein
MRKSLVVLAILGTMSVPAFAQATQTPAQNSAQEQAQPAKPQMIKKRVCEQVDENPYSRLGNRKICRTIEVPAPVASNGQQSAPSGEPQGK